MISKVAARSPSARGAEPAPAELSFPPYVLAEHTHDGDTRRRLRACLHVLIGNHEIEVQESARGAGRALGTANRHTYAHTHTHTHTQTAHTHAYTHVRPYSTSRCRTPCTQRWARIRALMYHQLRIDCKKRAGQTLYRLDIKMPIGHKNADWDKYTD